MALPSRGSRRTARTIGLVAAALAACAKPALETPPPTRTAAGRFTNHVIVVSIDGLRPDAIERFGAATLQRLMREGAYAPDAQTILPSSTLPSHTSMLTGVEPSVHGILWNTYRVAERGYVAVPTVFALARGAGFRTAAFFEKSKLHHIHPPGTIDHVASFDKRLPWRRSGHRTAAAVGRYVAANRPNLVFVHLADVDFAGHLFGWMGRMYGRAVRDVDSAVASLIAYADTHLGRGRYTVIITADHGGHGRRHGTARPDDTTIPWIIWGSGVRPGTRLPSGVRTTDTAATVLWLLGVAIPETWSGQPAMNALDSTAVAIPVAH